jgi:hypothetical protein
MAHILDTTAIATQISAYAELKGSKGSDPKVVAKATKVSPKYLTSFAIIRAAILCGLDRDNAERIRLRQLNDARIDNARTAAKASGTEFKESEVKLMPSLGKGYYDFCLSLVGTALELPASKTANSIATSYGNLDVFQIAIQAEAEKAEAEKAEAEKAEAEKAEAEKAEAEKAEAGKTSSKRGK